MKQNFTLLKTALLSTALFITCSTIKAQTLVAHFKFDNNLTDETGNYTLQAATGSTTTTFTPTFVDGRDTNASKAVSGFGPADFLETTGLFEIDGNESRTMCAWIKMNVLRGAGYGVLGLGEPATDKRWTFGPQGAKNRIEVNGTGVNGASTLAISTWYHIAVTYDGTTKAVKVYTDGAVDNSVDWSARSINTTATKLRIGNDYVNADPTLLTRGFDGAIDDVRIYTGAASDAQILSLYTNATLGVNKQSAESLNVYPNPVKDYMYFPTNKVSSVEIFNLLGSKIASQKIDGKLDMSSLAKGTYLISCQDSEGVNIATIKAIKE